MYKLQLLYLALVIKLVIAKIDDYVDENEKQCLSNKNALSCAKFTALSYLTTFAQDYPGALLGNSSFVQLVKLQNKFEDGSQFFPTARQLPNDNEFTKFFKYVKRQINSYMENQGVAFNLPEGAEVIDDVSTNAIAEEGRGKKKKAAMLMLPMIILFKLFKVKVMLALVLASVIFIKKAIMLGALILPTILQHVKHCSAKTEVYHPHHADHHYDHQDDYGGYAKEYQRAYQAYVKRMQK